MNTDELLRHYERVADEPSSLGRLRWLIFELAVRGKLTDFGRRETAVRPLGKLAEFIMGQAPPGSSCNEAGDGTVFVKVGEFGERFPRRVVWTTEPLKYAKQGDVLICVVGATIGKLNLAIDCAIGRSVAAIRPKDGLDQVFLYYSLMPVVMRLREDSRGSAQGVISRPDLAAISVWLPPIAEQHRIVAKVDELMALCDRLEAARAEREAARDRLTTASLARLNAPDPETFADDARFALDALPALVSRPGQLQQLRQTILNLAVSGMLVTQVPGDEPASELVRRIRGAHSPLAAAAPAVKGIHATLPASWTVVELSEIAHVGTGLTPSRARPDYFDPPVIPWVTSGETGAPFIASTAQHVSPTALKETSLRLYPPGTLLVAMYGQGKTRGQVTELQIEATTNQACAAIVLRLSDVGHRRYIKLFFEKMYDEIRELSAGGAQPNLNVGKIKSTTIPLPPLPEQHRIVAKVDELMRFCDWLEASLASAGAHRSRLLESLLHQALEPVELQEVAA